MNLFPTKCYKQPLSVSPGPEKRFSWPVYGKLDLSPVRLGPFQRLESI